MNKMEKQDYNQWRAMFAIARASFRSMLRSPSAIIFGLLFPLVFIVVFGFINPNNVKFDIALDQRSDTTGALFTALKNNSSLRFRFIESYEEQLQRLQKGRIDAIILLVNKENNNTSVTLTTSKASRERARLVEVLVNDEVANVNGERLQQLEAASPETIGSSNVRAATMITKLIPGREYKTIDFILPGQLGFSILSAGVFGTAFVFFSLRQTLVLKRFFATPIGRPFIILGEAISRVTFQLLGSLVIIIVGRLVFDFTLVEGWLTVFKLLLFAAVGQLVFMGFGFVVSGIARNESTIPPIANLITLPQFLLCGTFIPVDAFPSWLQMISRVLPLTYVNDSFRRIAFEGATFIELLPNLGIISLWGLIVFFLAVKFFRWE
jgi:ABC-2 type transport system permease protein